jgi:hypothetical protein
MSIIKSRFGALAVSLAVIVSLQVVAASAEVQPSYDTLRVENGGASLLYQPSILWSPVVVPLADGSAWAFFTTQVKVPTQPGADPILTNFQLHASQFDPASGTWGSATPLPGEISFGPSAVADSNGNVHLVYSIRNSLDDTSFGTLVYLRWSADEGWVGPSIVAPSETAGHQLSSDIAVDASGGVHVAWQDQRAVSEEARAADASNADVFVSDLTPDGTWTDPVQVNARPDDTMNASRPQLAVDGDRLIAVWSVYSPTQDIGLDSAIEVKWSARPLGDTAGWSDEATLFDRGEDLIGGRFIDAVSNPAGGVSVIYGRRTPDENQLYMSSLASGESTWSDAALIAAGNRGNYPRAAAGPDGTVYSVFNSAENGVSVKVGSVAVPTDRTTPGPETLVTEGEDGQQGIPGISVDPLGRVWIIYYYELPDQPAPSEVRIIRGAIVPSEPETVPVAAVPTVGSPEAEATPAG